MRPKLAALLLSCCSLLPGCNSHPRSPVIAVIQSTGGTEYWTRFADSARARAGRYGFALKWYAPQSAADYEVQAKLLNDAVQRHVDGIIIAPSHQLVLAEGVRRAYAEGIPVVVVHAPVAVQPTEFVTEIGCSDEVMGFMAAQRFTALHGARRILTVGASPTLQTTVQREDALRRALQRFSPEAHIVQSRYSLSDWARARQTTLDALQTDPAIDAIFATDEFTSHGVLSAARTLKAARPLTIIGVQNDGESNEALRSGLLSMAISCDSATEGQLAMDAMENALGKKPMEKLIQTEVLSFTKDSVGRAAGQR